MRYSFVVLMMMIFGMLAPPAADAANVASTLKNFGLIGTWSPDCSKDISEAGGSTVVFSMPSTGLPTATTREHRDISTTIVYSIEDATADGDKIRIALHPVKITRSGAAAASRHDYDDLALAFRKTGTRIEMVSAQYEGLPEVHRHGILEKCAP